MWAESWLIEGIIILTLVWNSLGEGTRRNPLNSFHCDFEENDCGITLITEGTYDTWYRSTRRACCYSPDHDMTTRSSEGHIMYLKEGDPLANEGQIVSAKSATPWIGGDAENYCIQFYLYTYGLKNEVNCTVYVITADHPPYVLKAVTGYFPRFSSSYANYFVKQWFNWPPMDTNISHFQPFQLLFEGQINGDTTDDRYMVAIDEVLVTPGLCTNELFCDFDDGYCGYDLEVEDQLSWDIIPSPSEFFPHTDHSVSGLGRRLSLDCTMKNFGGSGYLTSLPYVIQDTNTGHLHISTEEFPWCFQFWMAVNEKNEVQIELSAVADDDSVLLWTHIGSTPQHQSDPYTFFEIPIPRGVYQIQFKATCPYSGITIPGRLFLAIDEIAIAQKECTAKPTTPLPTTSQENSETTTEQEPTPTTTTQKTRPFLNFFLVNAARREDFWDSYTIAALCVLILAERFIWKGVLVA